MGLTRAALGPHCGRMAIEPDFRAIFAEIAKHMAAALAVWELCDPRDPGSLRLRFANAQARQRLGIAAEGALGQPISDLLPDDGGGLADAIADVVRTGEARCAQ